ncbi:hypothetical protein, partial [Streptomyces laurentii]|uniref:hypothetical protein n=1 Tax=Streptomyces laurentii TaxID=39478 RepID=UPI0036BFFC26
MSAPPTTAPHAPEGVDDAAAELRRLLGDVARVVDTPAAVAAVAPLDTDLSAEVHQDGRPVVLV